MSWFEHREEHDALRTSVRRFLRDRSDEAAVRRLMETGPGFDPETWAMMAGQLDLLGMSVPEEYGGQGFGQAEQHVLLGEMGRALLCAPFLSTVVLGLDALLASGERDLCAEIVPAVVSGTTRLALGLSGAAAPWVLQPPVLATGSGPVRRLRGRLPFVVDGASADRLLVVAEADEGSTLLLVADGAENEASVRRQPMTTLDLTRKQAELSFHDTEARVLAAPGEALSVLSGTFARARAALAAEGVGVCRRMLELSVDHATVRHQFDRPIGSFQAVKHLCTEMLIACELADSSSRAAGGALDEESAEAGVLSHLALAAAADACDLVAAETIEVHGGIGFTWEHPAHLFYKRAVSSARLWGTASWHRARLIERVTSR